MTGMCSSVPFGLLGAGFLLGCPLAAQQRGVEAGYGVWLRDDGTAFVSTLAFQQRILGPADYGFGLTHLADGPPPGGRTHTGALLSLGINRTGSGPYAVGQFGLGFTHAGGDPDAFWGAGLGYSLRPLPFLSLGIEAVYRAEDRRVRGFWRRDPADREGVALQGRLAVRFGGAGGGRPRTRTAEPGDRPSPERLATAAWAGDADEAASVRREIVATALDAMGTPYRWGGSDANGYDCSGLIHYAYGEHGLVLPRRSRDQVRTGIAVDRDVGALRPGDILGFAVGGSGVSHVGLYVGEGEFIHSTSSGVTLSSLTASDPDSRWWQARWVSARRIVP